MTIAQNQKKGKQPKTQKQKNKENENTKKTKPKKSKKIKTKKTKQPKKTLFHYSSRKALEIYNGFSGSFVFFGFGFLVLFFFDLLVLGF